MSGGHFDYKQYYLADIAEEIERLIATNAVPDGYGYSRDFNPAVIEKFRQAVDVIKLAQVYIHRIDYLVSGDDGEASFLKFLQQEIRELKAKP